MPMNLPALYRACRRYPLSLLYTGIICWGSLAPLPPGTLPQFRWSDKVVHLLMYLLLCLCIRFEDWRTRRAKERTAQRSPGHLRVIALYAPIALGGLLELAQAYLTTGRSGDVADFVANTLGCLLAAALAACNGRKAKSAKPQA